MCYWKKSIIVAWWWHTGPSQPPRATPTLCINIIFIHVSFCTVEKTQTNATNVTLSLLRQAIWGNTLGPLQPPRATPDPVYQHFHSQIPTLIISCWGGNGRFLGRSLELAGPGGSLVRRGWSGGSGYPPVGLAPVVAPSLNFASCNSRLRAPQPPTPLHPNTPSLWVQRYLVTLVRRFFSQNVNQLYLDLRSLPDRFPFEEVQLFINNLPERPQLWLSSAC